MKRHLFALAEHNRKLENERLYGPIKGLEFDGYVVDKETLELINRIRQNNWDDSGNAYKLPDGFKRCGRGSSYHVYVGSNFVVKSPLTCGRKPKKACPTKILNKQWRVQPRVQVYKFLSLETQKQLEREGKVAFGEMNFGAGTDCHWENFGLLKGELVQFDW